MNSPSGLLLAVISDTLLTAAASVLVVAIGGWLIYAFNRLVRHKNLMREAWSGIDVQLKRRHDLVPNLVETVKGYAAFERSLLEDITRLRSQSEQARGVKDTQTSENALSAGLKSLFAVAEGYPELKANRSFLDLQKRLAEIEDQLQMARRYYNGAARDFNIRVESFPSNIVARLFGFTRAEFFEIETATEREVPRVEV